MPEGKGWLMAEFGADKREDALETRASRDGNAEAEARRAQYEAVSPKKRTWRTSGRCARPDWARPHLFPASPTPGRDGKIPPWRRRSLADICASFARCIRSTNTIHRSTATLGRAACIAAWTSISPARQGSANGARSWTRRPDLCVKYGGSLSGEHGDGQARGEFLSKMFGEELIQAFREFKSIWDPDWKMNPGQSGGALSHRSEPAPGR